jgi:hypothetical protein
MDAAADSQPAGSGVPPLPVRRLNEYTYRPRLGYLMWSSWTRRIRWMAGFSIDAWIRRSRKGGRNRFWAHGVGFDLTTSIVCPQCGFDEDEYASPICRQA